MATEIKNTSEDVEMAEPEGENVVTMMDVLKEQEDFEENANAVLGGSDVKNCTYSKGYIKRQAIYACLTCCSEAKSDPNKRAGVCLACSLNCHETHELIELYTKRNFKCDCGNPKFNSHPCTFTPNKTDLNEDNIYNQNFSGLYCTCMRPYPDPESTEEDEMIQCIVCEDWLHASHLEITSEIKNMQYSEMICKNCMDKNEFLHDYSEFAVNIDILVDVVNGAESSNGAVINGDARNDEISNSSEIKQNSTSTNLDVEMSEEKMEDPAKNASEVKDDTVSKNSELSHKEEIASEIKENDMITETGQNEEKATLVNENTNKNEQDNSDIPENKIENDKKDNEEPADTKQSDKIETQEEMADKENDDGNEEERKEINEELPEVKEREVNPVESSDSKKESVDAENKLSEVDAEKMEEDRLLADTEENVKPNDQEKENNVRAESSEITAAEGNELANPATVSNKSESVLEVNVELEELKTTEDRSKEETNEKIQEENKTETLDSTEIKSIHTETAINKDSNEKEDSQIDKEDDNEPDYHEKISEKRKLSLEDTINDSEGKKQKLDDNNSGSCVRPKDVKRVHKGATFWPYDFRQKLCTCSTCIAMYKDLAVLFLIDPEDTVTAYENLGKSIINGKPQTQYEKGLEALSSLDRVQQINALTEYNIMKDKLLDFLKSFKDRREVVKVEDIRAFFAGMKPKKQPDGVYFCR